MCRHLLLAALSATCAVTCARISQQRPLLMQVHAGLSGPLWLAAAPLLTPWCPAHVQGKAAAEPAVAAEDMQLSAARVLANMCQYDGTTAGVLEELGGRQALSALLPDPPKGPALAPAVPEGGCWGSYAPVLLACAPCSASSC
jgi:hypothetical protein